MLVGFSMLGTMSQSPFDGLSWDINQWLANDVALQAAQETGERNRPEGRECGNCGVSCMEKQRIIFSVVTH